MNAPFLPPPEADVAQDENGIPPGKRLIRAGNGAGLSLGERLSAHLYRLSWRTPLHALRLKGRHPLKLLAAPADPLMGDADRGRTILAGRFSFEGASVAMGEDGPELGTAPERLVAHYHSFNWLRDVAAVGGDEAASAIRRFVAGWLAAHGNTVAEPAWAAGIAGRRLLNWPSFAPMLLGQNDLVFRSSVLNALARTARHLDRVADRTPPGLERIAAWCGIVAAGLLIAGGDGRRAFGEAGLIKALDGSLGEDGGLNSRSPAEQFELVALLSHLLSMYDARRLPVPLALANALSKAVPPLLGCTLGDGGMGSWQGGSPMSAQSVRDVVDASRVRCRPLRQARGWGYQRLAAGHTILIMDAGPPPHSRTTRHGCASTFAFEMSDGMDRLIVNCGGASAAGLIDTPGLAAGLRTTAAHSTLILADTNSTAVLTNGSVGKGVDTVELDRRESEQGSRVEGSHDGYAKRFGFTHTRSIAVTGDGKEVRGEDTLIPVEGRKKIVEAAFAARFHLAPGVDPSPTADGQGALLRIDGGALWQFRARGGAVSIEPSLWVNGEGRWQASHQIVVEGTAVAGGATIGWVIKRAG